MVKKKKMERAGQKSVWDGQIVKWMIRKMARVGQKNCLRWLKWYEW